MNQDIRFVSPDKLPPIDSISSFLTMLMGWYGGDLVTLLQHLKSYPELLNIGRSDGYPISFIFWHMCRLMDAGLTQILGLPEYQQIWFKEKWAEKKRYNPTGIGADAMGIGTGYSKEEVLAVPVLSVQELDAYFTGCFAAFSLVFENVDYDKPVPGYNAGFTAKAAFSVALVVRDCIEHFGQIKYIIKKRVENQVEYSDLAKFLAKVAREPRPK